MRPLPSKGSIIKAREGRPGQGVFMAAVTVAAVVILVVLKVIGRSTEVNRVRFFLGELLPN